MVGVSTYGQQRTGDQAEGDGGVDGLAHRVMLPRAKSSGNDHACTHRHTIKEADHHKDQTTGGADRRQGIVTYVVADAPGIEGIIKLLEHIAQEYRQGEQQHRLPNGALGKGILLGPQCGHLLSKNCFYYSTLPNQCKYYFVQKSLDRSVKAF